MVVVLPAPLAPTNPVIVPAGTSNDTSSTTGGPSNRLVNPLQAIGTVRELTFTNVA
jgi:hypothetical protein